MSAIVTSIDPTDLDKRHRKTTQLTKHHCQPHWQLNQTIILIQQLRFESFMGLFYQGWASFQVSL